jgi:hypothetical protein
MATPDEVKALHEMTVLEIGPLVASLATMQRVYKHNPECLWTIFRRPLSGVPRAPRRPSRAAPFIA